VGNDWDNTIARTLGPGQTLVYQYLASNGNTFWVQRVTNPVAAAGTNVTINPELIGAGERLAPV
jgi:hypothetical protein